MIAPKQSRYVVFEGAMLPYRLFGLVLPALGVVCLLLGFGILPRRITIALALPPPAVP
jgi:hypothetical protein